MEECPNCRNPIGGSLKELRAERDRLISFVTQQAALQRQFKQQDSALKERQKSTEKKETVLQIREANLLTNEQALDELLKEAKRPHDEWRQLEELNQKLIQELDMARNSMLKASEEFAEESRQQEIKQKLLKEKLSQTNQQLKSTAKKLKEQQELYEQLLERHSMLTRNMEITTTRLGEFSASNRELKESNARLSRELQDSNRRCTMEKNLVNSLNELNKQMNGRLEKLKRDNHAALERIQTLSTTEADLIERIEELKNAGSAPSFWFDPEILDYLFHYHPNDLTEEFSCPHSITTLGSGPIEIDDFDRLLIEHEFTPCSGNCSWIVVGRDGWVPAKLEAIIDEAFENGYENIRVFSQELFLLGYLTTHDPFSLPEEILMKFADGHPALEHLINSEFEWPEIILEELDEPRHVLDPRGSYDRVEESPLCQMGYRVGETRGLPFQQRRNILQKTYSDTIPWVGDDAYMEEWGRPSRTKRLWRMAHHIAREINKRKKIPNMKRAVRDWKEDLDWLKETFYKNGMRFKWPKI